MKETLRPGLQHEMSYLVPVDRTVPHLLPESHDFSDLPSVLATGYLVGIVEWACLVALRGHLDESESTLGIHVNLSHDAPTLPGSTITVTTTLAAREGKVLTFEISVADDNGIVSVGTHQRGVIDRTRFGERLILLGKRSGHAQTLVPTTTAAAPTPSTINARARRLVLRTNALWLLLASAAGLLYLDIGGIFFGRGPASSVFEMTQYIGIGFIEAHGLALVIGVLLWRGEPQRTWHLTAAVVGVLLGTCNLVFWQFFVVTDSIWMGVVATSLHWTFAGLQSIAAVTARRDERV